MKVLIIDDNSEITEILKKYLKLEKIDAVVSNTGEDGLAMIKNDNFDKILLDLSMPNITGIDVLEKLKQDEFDMKKIHIFSASLMNDNEKDELLKIGVNSFIKKPIDMPKLIKTLKS